MKNMRMFGTSGVRGEAESFFTNQFCFDLGRTFAKFLDHHKESGPIALGRDPRSSGQRIKDYFASGLQFEGKEVLDQGIIPIPALNWILISAPYSASAMISGSHIREDLNGIKFFAFRKEILKVHEKEIEEIYQGLKEKVSFREAKEIPREEKAEFSYRKMLIDLAEKPYPPWKVVLDTGNGAQTNVIPYVLERLGLKLVKINTDLGKPLIARDTEIEGVFLELQNKVLEEKADLGIGFDADGDRVVFIDEKGNLFPEIIPDV